MAKAEWRRESLPLTVQDWEALDRIAAQHEATATGGRKAGEPTWRALVRQIARGSIVTLSREEWLTYVALLDDLR